MFTAHHPARLQDGDERARDVRSRTTPFYSVTRDKESAYTFPEVAEHSINGLKDFDASPNVFVCLAHDGALFDVLPLFNDDSEATICDWSDKGYKDRLRWGFLNELPKGSKPGRDQQVVGLHRNGRKIALGPDLVFKDVQGVSETE